MKSLSSLRESYSSKKFWFAVLSVTALFGFAWLAGARIEPMKSMYDAFVGGVVAIASLYMAGNVANKFVLGRSKKKVVTPPPEPPKND